MKLSKWHITDESGEFYTACHRVGEGALSLPRSEWVRRCASDKCEGCARWHHKHMDTYRDAGAG
jgi:hypothetical protein